MREVLERLSVPEQESRFFDELRARMQEQDRRAARRWRRLTVGLGTLTVAAVAAAAVVAATRGGGSVVDRTVSCQTQIQGGLHAFDVNAGPTYPGFDSASFGVGTGGSSSLLAVDTRYKGFTLDGTSCRTVKTRVPLTRSGLPSAGVYRQGEYGGFSGRCLLPGQVLIRVRLHLDGSGKPQSAMLAVRMQRKHRPIAFVQWSPKKVTGYLSSACTTS